MKYSDREFAEFCDDDPKSRRNHFIFGSICIPGENSLLLSSLNKPLSVPRRLSSRLKVTNGHSISGDIKIDFDSILLSPIQLRFPDRPAFQ